MRIKFMTQAFAVLGASLCVIGVAAAQKGLVTPPPQAQQGPAVDQEANLPAAQLVALVAKRSGELEAAVAAVRTMLEQARAARDIVKSLCLNDKLQQMDVAMKAAKDRQGSLTSAASDKDTELARHEFVMFMTLHERLTNLQKEANQCIGEEAGFVGESQTSHQPDPNTPNNNLDQLGADPEIVSGPPDLSSPTF